MVGAILGIAILQSLGYTFGNPTSNPKQTFVSYNILAMVFIARASVLVHMDNRKKFLYFQKAYGLNTLAYTLTWVLYSLIIGAFKFFVYILIVYIYWKGNDDYFSSYFIGYGYPGERFFITYEQNCLMNFLCYLSVYSYCLFFAVLIQHNQIGLKLLSPFIVVGIVCILQPTYMILIDMKKLILISPIGWILNISSYRELPPNRFFEE
jgi:hypothetical protein